jgi:hypothetical protein
VPRSTKKQAAGLAKKSSKRDAQPASRSARFEEPVAVENDGYGGYSEEGDPYGDGNGYGDDPYGNDDPCVLFFFCLIFYTLTSVFNLRRCLFFLILFSVSEIEIASNSPTDVEIFF